MSVLTRFLAILRRNAEIITALVIFLATPQLVMASEKTVYDVSKSWFKPSLTVNDEPAICTPLLKGYMNYFKSAQATNPLEADFVGQRGNTDSIAIINKKLHEVKWESAQVDDIDLKVAQFKLNGKYYAIVRRYYSIGWREGFFYDIIIPKPIAEYQLTKETHMAFFEANNLGILAATNKKNIFDVVYKDDPRYTNYKFNTFTELSNIYMANGAVYLSLRTDKPHPNTYMILKLMNQNRLSLTCSLQTTPTNAQIEAQYDKLQAFTELKRNLFYMMGNEGNCGTLNSLSSAKHGLNNALNTMFYRPWANQVVTDSYYHDQPDRRLAVDESLALWGYSGIWNYYKYKSYLSHLPKAQREIKNFYVKNFALSEKKANELADTAISFSLIVGFDHGRNDDKSNNLHKRILEGMSVEELRQESIGERDDNNDGESLLTFAIMQPKLLRVLLEKGLNPNRQNAFGKTPLMYAAQFNSLEAIKILLEHGALTELTTVSSIDTCNYTIQTKNVSALHYAVRYSSGDIIKLLLDYGAPTYIADSNGHTPYDYLIKFGGIEEYMQPKKVSYGDLNQLLTDDDRRSLKLVLLPPEDDKKIVLSLKENLNAEKLYQQGKLQEAYRSLRRAISLNPNNERARANMSLVALKLGKLGESARVSTSLIETAKSDTEKANAYFNLGLACQKAGLTGYHYATIEYDGLYYCSNAWWYGPKKKKNDRSTFANFLAAYKLHPTQERLNVILALIQDIDMNNKKRVCKFPEDGTGIKSLYFSGMNLYFLLDSPKELPFKKTIRRYGAEDTELTVHSKESIPLTDKLKIEQWVVDGANIGSLMMDTKICSPAFPIAFGTDTKLIEIFSSSSTNKTITLKQDISTPVVLVLYGDDIKWTIEGDLSKTVGVYVHGLSTVSLPTASGVSVFTDKTSVYPDPKGSSFNAYTWSTIGLGIDSIIDVGQNIMTVLTDKAINDNKLSPKKTRVPSKSNKPMK